MPRCKIRHFPGGEREIEVHGQKILRLGLDPEGMLLAALTDGIVVDGIPLPEGYAMVASPGNEVVLPDGKTRFTVQPKCVRRGEQ